MADMRIRIPKSLESERKSLEIKVGNVISMEAKRKALSDFMDGLLSSGNQVGDEELIAIGRLVKKGRAEKLRAMAAQ